MVISRSRFNLHVLPQSRPRSWTPPMLRYQLRTLLILLAILPPLLAVGWWKYSAWKAEQARRAAQAEREKIFNFYFGATR